MAADPYLGSNVWRAYPDHAVPASEGAMYLVAGQGQWQYAGPLSVWFYMVPYLAWENPITSTRPSGGGLDGGPAGADDTAIGFGLMGGASFPWANSTQPFTYYGLSLSSPAPANAEGVHLDIHAGGFAAGQILVGANVASDDSLECDVPDESVSIADPIDTRSGEFYLTERDFGIETGCQGVSLHFARTYRSMNPVINTPFGYGWTHNYNQAVVVLNEDYVAVQRPRGSYLLFQDIGGDVYATKPGAQQTLIKRPGGGWVLVHQSRQVDMFDADGRLIAQQDANGNMVWLTYEEYDRNGQTGTRLARVDAPGGRFLWFGYNYYRPTVLTQITDHTGRTVYYSYDEGSLATVIDPSGGISSYTYNNWFMTSKTDPLEQVAFTNLFDSGGRVISQPNSLGQDLRLEYEVTTSAITTTVTEQGTGAQTIYVYNSNGLLQQVVAPSAGVTVYRGYTDTRRPTEIEDALGHITHIQYDERALPIAVTDALSHTVLLEYDNWSNPTVVTDTLGRVTQFIYDGPNLAQVIDPAGNDVRFLYEDQAGWQNMLTHIINQAGVTTTLTYDAAGDLVQLTDPCTTCPVLFTMPWAGSSPPPMP